MKTDLFLQNHDELELLKNEYLVKYEGYNLRDQPYVVCCGSLNKLQCCHVIFNNLEYNFKNVVYAVDFIYKLYFVLSVDFTLASSHIWGFIQKHVFSMEKERRLVGVRASNELSAEISRI